MRDTLSAYRSSFALLVCLAVWIGFPSALWSAPRIDPDKIDLGMDVSTISAEEVMLYRAAILVRHCHSFPPGPLRSEYRGYLKNHCGIAFDYERRLMKVPPAAPDSNYTPEETAFLRRLDAREAKLRARQVRTANAGPVFDPAAIVNRSQFFEDPSDTVMASLVRDGIVVLPGGNDQLFHVYEQNDYAMIPSFITTDAVLQMYHMYFDYSLREMERERLLATVRELSDGIGKRLATAYASAPAGSSSALSLRRAILYFAVASVLADSAGASPPWMDRSWSETLHRQINLIQGMDSTRSGPVLGTIDYTMFRPRGHYTRSEAFKRFFRTMMWFGLPGFILDEELTPIETTLAVCHALYEDPHLQKQYDRIYEPTRYFVGPTDDITPMLVKAVADSICGAGSTLEQWVARGDAIRASLIRRDPTRIRSDFGDDRDAHQVRFMGMRYLPDSEILQRMRNPHDRRTPSALDIFCVMDVPAAIRIQKGHQGLPAWYWPAVDSMRAQFGDFQAPAGADNLYWRWIHLLRTVNRPAPAGATPCMTGKAWEIKNLNASLASWSELRHDTILYAKQAGGAECGGGETPPRTLGYVEARPDVYREMRDLLQMTREEMEGLGLLGRRLRDVAGEVDDMLAFLENTSGKEIRGETLSKAEYERIRIFGSELEQVTGTLLMDPENQAGLPFEGVDRSVAVVADVHSGDASALEEGVGYADEMYALVVIDGALTITRGAVFSYYEFEHPKLDRLTDEKWQEMLEKDTAPPRPSWISRILIGKESRELPDRYVYSSGC